MGWERRGTAGPYYYRSLRRGRRVVKQYFGAGDEAQRAPREDAERRASRAAQRQAVREETGQVQPIARLTNNVAIDANLLLEAVLLASGLHRHNYGPWRARRGG